MLATASITDEILENLMRSNESCIWTGGSRVLAAQTASLSVSRSLEPSENVSVARLMRFGVVAAMASAETRARPEKVTVSEVAVAAGVAAGVAVGFAAALGLLGVDAASGVVAHEAAAADATIADDARSNTPSLSLMTFLLIERAKSAFPPRGS
jgi:hypothetical protein